MLTETTLIRLEIFHKVNYLIRQHVDIGSLVLCASLKLSSKNVR